MVLFIFIFGISKQTPTSLTFFFICNAEVRSLGIWGLDSWRKNLSHLYTSYFLPMKGDNGFIGKISFHSDILFALLIKGSKTFASNISEMILHFIWNISPFSSCSFFCRISLRTTRKYGSQWVDFCVHLKFPSLDLQFQLLVQFRQVREN